MVRSACSRYIQEQEGMKIIARPGSVAYRRRTRPTPRASCRQRPLRLPPAHVLRAAAWSAYLHGAVFLLSLVLPYAVGRAVPPRAPTIPSAILALVRLLAVLHHLTFLPLIVA